MTKIPKRLVKKENWGISLYNYKRHQAYEHGWNDAVTQANEFRDAVVEALEEMDKICMICSRPSSVLLDNLIQEIKGE